MPGNWSCTAELQHSTDRQLRGNCSEGAKETSITFAIAPTGWCGLGDGTEESQSRVQGALDDLWRFTAELFVA